jgi:penicillin-binding protein 1A
MYKKSPHKKTASTRETRRRRTPKRRLLLRFLLCFAAVLILATGAVVVGAYFYFTYDLPQLFSLNDYKPPVVSQVFADDGTLIGEFYKERRVPVQFSEIPPQVIQAFIAAEDAEFFTHPGIDLSGIIRACVKNLLAGRIVQGGSTITQQVTRTLLLTPEKSYGRKIKEMILAYRLEHRLTKEAILYLYLNQIYLGHGAYGIESAANVYFGKSIRNLNLAEIAMLAGLPQAPSRYSPFSNPRLAKERQIYVLNRMVKEGFITREEATRAMNTPLQLAPERRDQNQEAPYFVEYVRKYLEAKYGTEIVQTEGLKIYTTVNREKQKAAEQAVREGLLALDKRIGYRGPLGNVPTNEREHFCRNMGSPVLMEGTVVKGMVTHIDKKAKTVRVCLGGEEGEIALPEMRWARKPNPEIASDYARISNPAEALKAGDVILVKILRKPETGGLIKLALEQEPEGQGALLCMEAKTGHVKALVGGLDYKNSQFNRAIQAKRQPGSAFKPIIYAAAIDRGFTPSSIFIDSPIVFDSPGQGGVWKPENYEEKFYGPTLLRTALIHSRNVVTVKILQRIGVDYAIKYARKLGITSDLVRNLSLALGSSDVTLLELTRAYSAFCTGGRLMQPIFITKVLDRNGGVLEENYPSGQQVISEETAAIMTHLLQEVVESGTGWRVKALNRPAAGKTGTTNDLKDAWFIGFTPSYVTGVWVGFDDGRSLGKLETGGRAASPIWLNFMQRILWGEPEESFPTPSGVVFTTIDPNTGRWVAPDSPGAVAELFKSGTQPSPEAQQQEYAPVDFFKMDLESSTSLQ